MYNEKEKMKEALNESPFCEIHHLGYHGKQVSLNPLMLMKNLNLD